MILSLIASLGGGLMRLLPEVFAFMNKKTDNAHELAMLDKQFQLEQTRAQARMDEIRYQGGVDAQKSALQGQMQKTGIRWVDAANFALRPIVTNIFVALYVIVKIAMFVAAVAENGHPWAAVLAVYDQEDRAILTGLLSFWFVGRAIDKYK